MNRKRDAGPFIQPLHTNTSAPVSACPQTLNNLVKRSLDLERTVSHQVRQALIQRHWRVIRNNVTKVQFQPGIWTQFNEPGTPDLLAIHYLNRRGLSAVLWVETKRQRGGKLGEDQVIWRSREAERGAVVIVTSDAQQFLAEYEQQLGWIHRPPYSIPGHQTNLNL